MSGQPQQDDILARIARAKRAELQKLRAAVPPRAALVDLFIHRVYSPARLEGEKVVAKGAWSEPRVSAWIVRGELNKPLHIDLGPAAQLQDNLLRWRNEEHYPPRDANWTTLHLSAGSRLNPAPGAAGSVELAPVVANQDVMRSDPTPVRTSADFLYGPVEKELLISGLPRVHVTVTPREPGGYIAAWLYDRDPATGAEKRIGWTSMSLRYYEGGDKPMTVVPGQPIVAKMEIQPMDAALPAGHQLLLRVWVNTHSDRIPSPPPAVLALNYGGSVKSIVELPIIERGVDAYFEPPQPK